MITKLVPSKAESYYLKGRCLYELKRYKEAIKTFDKAIKLAPDTLSYHYNGQALYRLKEYNKAIDWSNKALAIVTDDDAQHIIIKV